jgi:hypothetical protein
LVVEILRASLECAGIAPSAAVLPPRSLHFSVESIDCGRMFHLNG